MTDAQATVLTEVSWSTNPGDVPVWVSVDAVKPHQESGSTSRGRGYEQDAAQAGQGDWLLDNADADFSPGVGNITTDKRIRTRVTPPAPYNGTTYGVFDGYIESLQGQVDANGFENGRTSIRGKDGFQWLSLAQLLSTIDSEAMAASPLAYYPCGDLPGSTAAGSLGSGVIAAALKYRGQSGGGAKFGGTPFYGPDPGGSLELSPVTGTLFGGIVTLGGYYLEMPAAVWLSPAAGFSVRCTMAGSAGVLPSGFTVWTQWSAAGFKQAQLLVSATDAIAHVFDNTGTLATYAQYSFPVAMDGLPHEYEVRLQADKRTLDLFVDGTLRGTGTAAADVTWGATQGLIFGTGEHAGGGANSWSYVSGRLGKIGIWNRPRTNAEITAAYQATLGFAGEAAGARIARILNYAGWPAAQRALDTGQSTTGPLLSAGQDALSLIQAVTLTEQGVTFVAGNGNLTFLDRARTRNTVSRVTLGTAALPVEDDLTFDLDDTRIKNLIRATRPNGPTIEVRDATSIAAHWQRVYAVTYEVASDHELIDAASWEITNYKNPRVRSGQVTLDPLTAPALWPWALGLELGDRITISNLPSYAPAASIDYIVLAIAHRWTQSPQQWRTTLTLSPPLPYATLRADAAPSALTKLDNGLKIAY